MEKMLMRRYVYIDEAEKNEESHLDRMISVFSKYNFLCFRAHNVLNQIIRNLLSLLDFCKFVYVLQNDPFVFFHIATHI